MTTQRRGKGLKKDDKGSGDTAIILYGELYTTYGDYITDIASRCDDEVATGALPVSYGDILLPISSTTRKAQIGKASVLKVSKPVYMGGDTVSLTPKDGILSDYLMYCINGKAFEEQKMKCVKGTTIQHLSPSMMYDIEIPVPPLAVQREVVRVLDTMTELTTELTDELTAREKQYAYYRDALLKLEGVEGVEYRKLEEIAEIRTGKGVTKKDMSEDGLYPIISGGKEPMGFYHEKNRDANTVTVARAGTAGYVSFMTQDFYLNDKCFSVIPKDNALLPKYLYYALKNSEDQLTGMKSKGTVPTINTAKLGAFEIPIPPLQVQQDIVTRLDAFSSYCTDLTSGLPSEIAARERQYAYYRDLLLSFPPVQHSHF